MKKTVVMVLTAVFLLSMMSVFACAESYSDELVSFDVPEMFSSKTENKDNDAIIILWENPENGSNINLTVTENSWKECYADLSDSQLQELESVCVAQFESESKDSLEMYSIDFKIVESNTESVEISGAKGALVDMEVEYVYSDGSVVPAAIPIYMFSTEESVIAISGTLKLDEEKDAFESCIQSLRIKGEIYVSNSDTGSGVIWFTIFGAMLGVLIGLIIAVRSKKKKQKTVQPGFNENPNQFNNNGSSSDPMNPNNIK